jgi:lipopolysaccharide/colanic/teichoic acid biosynthesis glycosyltransferase
MILKKWEQLPEQFQTDAVRPYYEHLRKKQASLVLKRIFDIFVSAVMLIILCFAFAMLINFAFKEEK